jgi:hypothetical protein
MGSYGDFYLVAIYKKFAQSISFKISRVAPLTALNIIEYKKLGVAAIKN